MERLTTNRPINNIETLHNYAYINNREVFLSYADGEANINLCEYISKLSKSKGCGVAPTPQEVMEGACMECDCELAILYCVSVQAAELREALKAYEDTGLTPEEVTGLVASREAAKASLCEVYRELAQARNNVCGCFGRKYGGQAN